MRFVRVYVEVLFVHNAAKSAMVRIVRTQTHGNYRADRPTKKVRAYGSSRAFYEYLYKNVIYRIYIALLREF